MTSPRPPSPLELFHPDGAAGRSLVLGGACPEPLRASLTEEGDGAAGLVVVAPTRAEARDVMWLRGAVRSAARALTPDGLVYLLAPPGRRRAVVRAARRAGLAPAATFVHLPQVESSRHLVSAERRALGYALGSLLARSPRRRLAALATAAPGGALPFRLLAGTGVVMRPPGARPLLEWLRAPSPRADLSRAILTRAWRAAGGATVVHVFEGSGSEPIAVAKVRPAAGERAHAAELRSLHVVAATARLAGADAPTPLAEAHVGGHPVLFARAVGGRPAAAEVAQRPELVEGLLDRVAGWLETWNRATCVPDGFSAEEVAARLTEPVRLLAGHLPDAAAYETWLRGLAVSVPAVAAHNDLTTANILVAPGGRLGLVDWESARERDLPLRDLVYAIVDAHLLAGRFASRAAAFDACFAGDGEETVAARRHVAALRRALGLDASAVLACFHACWLEHAANDIRRVPGAESEFVAIAARLARTRAEPAKRLAGSD